MCYKACRGLISDTAGSSQRQAYGAVWLSSALHREEKWDFAYLLSAGTRPRLSPCIAPVYPWGQVTCETPPQPSGAQLLWEKVHWSTPSCSPWLSLPSPCHVSLPLLFWKLWAEYFQTLEYFQIWRLIEIHVIYVWKWSRWTWHLILCWSNALNFNLCSATCFFTLSKPQQLSVPQPTHLFKHIWWYDPLQLTHILWDCCRSALACD